MTVITITTIGYGEVHILSDEGRKFTILLLFFSMVTAGYSVTTVISFIFEGQIVDLMRGKRMEQIVSFPLTKLLDDVLLQSHCVLWRFIF